MTENYSWVDTGNITYNDVEYNIAEYYDHNRDISGGYLLELNSYLAAIDGERDISEFDTSTGMRVAIYLMLWINTVKKGTIYTVKGVKYKVTNVTSIGSQCFSGCSNLRKITVKTKSIGIVGKNAFKGIYIKAVIKVSKGKLKKYKKLMKKKGQALKVKIK